VLCRRACSLLLLRSSSSLLLRRRLFGLESLLLLLCPPRFLGLLSRLGRICLLERSHHLWVLLLLILLRLLR